MKAEIRRYEDSYDVVSPEELAQQLDGDEAEGWDDLTAWRTTRQNLAVAQAALAYDDEPVTSSLYEWGRPRRRVRTDLSPGAPADS